MLDWIVGLFLTVWHITERQTTQGLLLTVWYITEEQTTQWPKEKGQKDKQRSTKHTNKTKDQVTRTPIYLHSFCFPCSTSKIRNSATR